MVTALIGYRLGLYKRQRLGWKREARRLSILERFQPVITIHLLTLYLLYHLSQYTVSRHGCQMLWALSHLIKMSHSIDMRSVRMVYSGRLLATTL